MTDLASPPPLQDHRFGELIKGHHFAYARGLTINPTHLPVALDAMMDDGWELMAIFGETKSEKVGFVFKRMHSRDKRITELLEANNREVEGRRVAQTQARDLLGHIMDGD
jgi:hypothetical protein